MIDWIYVNCILEGRHTVKIRAEMGWKFAGATRGSVMGEIGRLS